MYCVSWIFVGWRRFIFVGDARGKAPDPHLISAVFNNSEKFNDKEMQKRLANDVQCPRIEEQRRWP
jgi:hypothetical protein